MEEEEETIVDWNDGIDLVFEVEDGEIETGIKVEKAG